MSPLVVTQVMNVVYEVTTLVVVVLGLAIVFGFLGVLNLAHGEFIAIGAYTAFVCQARGWPYLAAVPATLLVCAVLGLVVERGVIRPLYQRPFDTMLATWGLSLLLRKAVELIYGGGYKSLVVPVPGSIDVLGAPFPAYRTLLIVLSLAGIAGLLVWYRRSPTGARLKAMVGNPELAQAVGIRTDRLARNTFVVGTCFAGLAGVMVAPLTPVQPYMGLDYILKAFFVLVVGGLGSALGLVTGAGVIGGVESAVSAIMDRTWGYSTVLLIAIVFLWLRPRGIFARA
jgi:branched-chain amino acid transport system permease protein/urea transport system permease protein